MRYGLRGLSYQYTSLRSLGVGFEVSGDDGWIGSWKRSHIISYSSGEVCDDDE